MSENKYLTSKVYELVCQNTGLKYVGSTTETLLSKRLAGHVSAYKRWSNGHSSYVSSFEIIKGNNYYINLLELCSCSCKDELLKCEREWISKTECVNKIKKPILSAEEKLSYYKDNIEIITMKKCVKTFCGCGGWYRNDNKVHHLATIKHKNWLILNELFEKQIIIDEDKESVYEEMQHLELDLELLMCD